MKNQHDVLEALRFFLSEISRVEELRRRDPKGFLAENGIPAFIEFVSEGKQTVRLTGREAERRLFRLAAKLVADDPDLVGRVSAQSFYRTLRDEFATRHFADGMPVGGKLASVIVQSSRDAVLPRMVDRTYFFPAFAFHGGRLVSLEVGAAKFMPADEFVRAHSAAWETSIAEGKDDGWRQLLRHMFDSAQRRYAGADWVVGVDVPRAEPVMAWQRAADLLEHSFNVLRLIVPYDDRHFIGRESESPAAQEVATLELDSSGKFLVSEQTAVVSFSASGGDLDEIRRDSPELGLLEATIRKIQSWQELTENEERTIRSLRWFGEAWKEQDPIPRIVKFATSLECAVTTGDREGITEQIAERVAFLLGSNGQGRQTVHQEVRDVYDRRSKAVHGDRSPVAELVEFNRKAERLARNCILAMVGVCDVLDRGGISKSAGLKELFRCLKFSQTEDPLDLAKGMVSRSRSRAERGGE